MVKKRTLFLLAGIVWSIAGFDVLRLGVLAYASLVTPLRLALSAAVFAIFQAGVFGRLVKKHTARILSSPKERFRFWEFFDRRSFCIMAFMIVMGVSLRAFHLVPEVFIAVFYSGLGASLFLAGLLFFWQFLQYSDEKKEDSTMYQKLIRNAFVSTIAALCCGVFYREFTKFYDFTGKTTLAFTHLHLMVLGTFLFLVLALFCLHTDLAEQKYFLRFRRLYAVALPFLILMFFVRGIAQAMALPLSAAANGAIAGFAGISHILMALSLIFLFLGLKNAAPLRSVD